MKIEDLSKFFSALDNPVKLRIVDLISREGSQSLTDIRNKLKISFSTTFKYLNQMEDAGVLKSKRDSYGGREKNLYSLEKFDFSISEHGISELLGEKEKPRQKNVTILDYEGRVRELELSFIEGLISESGVPKRVANHVKEKIFNRIYDGISLEELRQITSSTIQEESEFMERIRNSFQSSEIFFKRKNFLDILNENGNTDIVRAHIERDIHIRNVGKTYPLSFQHNFLLALKHGLKVVGINTKPAGNIVAAVSHLESIVKAVNENIADLQQSFDHLNIFLAPFVGDIPRIEAKQAVERIIYSLDQLYTISNIKTGRIFLNLETCVPDCLKKIPAYLAGREVGVLSDYEAEAKELLELFIEVLARKGKTQNPKLVIKIRNKRDVPENIEKVLDQIYLANLIPDWQNENANYMFDWCRFESGLKDWKRSVGVPELQMITLNLPRLALLSKDEGKILETISEKFELIKKCMLSSLENIASKRISELNFLSHKTGDDSYCNFDDGICLIGVIGMNEMMKNLGLEYSENKDLALKILKHMKKESKILQRIRTGLVELDFTPVSQSFAKSDNIKFRSQHAKYTGGVDLKLDDEEKIDFLGDFHRLLKGGHMCKLSNLDAENINKILKSNIGLATGKGIDVI